MNHRNLALFLSMLLVVVACNPSSPATAPTASDSIAASVAATKTRYAHETAVAATFTAEAPRATPISTPQLQVTPSPTPISTPQLQVTLSPTPMRTATPNEIVLYRENFDSGSARGWVLDPGLTIADGVLCGVGTKYMRLNDVGWRDYRVQFRFQIVQNGIHFNFRENRKEKYIIQFDARQVNLVKPTATGDFPVLTSAQKASNLNEWHQAEVVGLGGRLQIKVDGELIIDYTDPQPISQGTISFAFYPPGSRSCIDDMVVYSLSPTSSLAPTPATATRVPVTMTPTPSIINLSPSAPYAHEFRTAYSLGPLTFHEVSRFGRYQVASIEVADLDSDGDLDLILTSEENDSIIQVYENLGKGVFRNSGNSFAFQSPDKRHWNFGVVVADFNRDGFTDIAAADAWAGLNIYFSSGKLRYRFAQNYTYAGMVEVKGLGGADLDGDGDIDLILGDFAGEKRGYQVLFNNGSGKMVDSGQPIDQATAWDVFVIDLNRDGAPDYISINRYAKEPSRVHLNNGKGFFTKTFDIPDALDDSYDIKCFAKGDYTYCFIGNSEDLRGRLNRFLIFDKIGELITNKGFSELHAGTDAMCLVDLNADGNLELIAGNYNGNSLAYFFKPDARGILDFERSIPLFAIPQTTSIGCGDLNGDGLIDLVIGAQDRQNAIMEYRLLLQQPPK